MLNIEVGLERVRFAQYNISVQNSSVGRFMRGGGGDQKGGHQCGENIFSAFSFKPTWFLLSLMTVVTGSVENKMAGSPARQTNGMAIIKLQYSGTIRSTQTVHGRFP